VSVVSDRISLQLNIVRQWEQDYDFITIVIIINLRFVTLCKVNLSVKRFDQLYIIVLNHLPCHDHNTNGSKIMGTTELSIIVMMSVAGFLWALMSYSVGYKQGQREGYARGRAVSRHMSAVSK
jgi:hypothetical protein